MLFGPRSLWYEKRRENLRDRKHFGAANSRLIEPESRVRGHASHTIVMIDAATMSWLERGNQLDTSGVLSAKGVSVQARTAMLRPSLPRTLYPARLLLA